MDLPMYKIATLILFLLFQNKAFATPIINATNGISNPANELNFNEISIPVNTQIIDQYADYGVSFSGMYFNSSCCNSMVAGSGFDSYLSNVGSSAIPGYPLNWHIYFDHDQSYAAFKMLSDFGTYNVVAKLDGIIVENIATGAGGIGYFGFTDIRFDEIWVVTSQYLHIDNLQYSTAREVPEPETKLPLLFLFALYFASRRKSRIHVVTTAN